MEQSLDNHFKSDTQYMERTTAVLESVDKHLDVYGEQLRIHIQGVKEAHRHNELLGEELKLFKADLELKLKEQELDIEELKKPAVVIKGVLWLVAAISAILALVITIRSAF